MANVIRIVAAVVDTKQLTLYREDGSTLVLLQGDPRVRLVLDQASPILARGGVAEVSLDRPNEYKKFEEASNGKVSFFSIAKKKLASFFNKKDQEDCDIDGGIVNEQVLGNVPKAEPEPRKEEELKAAIDEIMAHAVPVSSPAFVDVLPPQSNEEQETHTIIAVTENKVIPDVHKIRPQIGRANALGSPQGVEAFLARLANVIDKRRHSVEDLLKFMEKGDLPIADDGSIIIYKVLNKQSGKEDVFVDCHTRRVPQKVGSYVCMDESLVDPNRGHECSNGLHVARRGYIGNFSGDVCVIAKVAPEDVIAVPNYDANKMRVCGYHILFLLSKEDHQKLRQNRAITDTSEAKQLIGKAIAGDHVGRLEEVRITRQLGEGVQITPLVEKGAQPEALKANRITEDSPQATAIEENETAMPVHPKELTEVVMEAETAQVEEAAPEPATPLSRQQIAQDLYVTMTTASTALERKAAAQSLRNHKKKTKLGWHALGLKDGVAEQINKLLD